MKSKISVDGQQLLANEMAQVKFTIEAGIISKFKSRCAYEGVSMTSVIRQYMKNCQPTKDIKVKSLTRPLRRMAVMKVIGLLNNILDLETAYRDNIPEQFAQRYEAADHTCDQLSEAIACLEEAF